MLLPLQIRGLYKGMASPLFGMALINAVLFGTNGFVMRKLEPNGGTPQLRNVCIAGMSAGFVQTIICCPSELIKLRMQIQAIGQEGPGLLSMRKSSYIGPLVTIRNIYRTEGLLALNKGYVVTLWREVPSYGAYFTTNNLLCAKWASWRNIPVDSIGPVVLGLAGGVSGIAAWVITYPFDVVKSRLQVDGVTSEPKYKGIVDCFSKSYRSDGITVFVRGLNSTVIRAFPTNAATWCTYTLVLRYWKRYDQNRQQL